MVGRRVFRCQRGRRNWPLKLRLTKVGRTALIVLDDVFEHLADGGVLELVIKAGIGEAQQDGVEFAEGLGSLTEDELRLSGGARRRTRSPENLGDVGSMLSHVISGAVEQLTHAVFTIVEGDDALIQRLVREVARRVYDLVQGLLGRSQQIFGCLSLHVSSPRMCLNLAVSCTFQPAFDVVKYGVRCGGASGRSMGHDAVNSPHEGGYWPE